MAETFTCEYCKETFDNAWSEEEAKAEALEAFGTLEDMAVICDPCWKKMGFG